jgi:hypothetical protein
MADDNKAEFIRALPGDMPADEVVERAKKVGLSFSRQYVYTIRSSDRRSRAGEAKGLRDELRRIAARLGLDEARRVIDELEARLNKRR